MSYKKPETKLEIEKRRAAERTAYLTAYRDWMVDTYARFPNFVCPDPPGGWGTFPHGPITTPSTHLPKWLRAVVTDLKTEERLLEAWNEGQRLRKARWRKLRWIKRHLNPNARRLR